MPISGRFWPQKQELAMNRFLILVIAAMVAAAGLSSSAMAAPEQGIAPMFGCSRIIITQVDRYTITVESGAFVSHDAKVLSRTYDFGDGTIVTTDAPWGAPVTHTYTRAGSYRITAIFHFDVGGRTATASNSCQSRFTVAAPSTRTITVMAQMLACQATPDTNCRETITVP